ncbi:ankyrin repeat-containing protein BDA1-like [Humulus lupulus]|uniref:ankyrin repeat-containing protein BDA1-like n=1 Tax=Humulus lupulus TaxID=3486 RepID=UPI002B409295|nr:ankyrin repeat-containing protein BDA1-like [Humulus lupulus]
MECVFEEFELNFITLAIINHLLDMSDDTNVLSSNADSLSPHPSNLVEHETEREVSVDDAAVLSSNVDSLSAQPDDSLVINESTMTIKEELEATAREGDINKLYKLIKRDPHLLDRIDAIPFVDTPMHIAASFGKASFTMEIMRLKPSFARKQNHDGLTPMHLALKKGRIRVLRRLIDTNSDLVRVKGKEGRTVLHWVVEKIDQNTISFDILDQLLSACPQSIEDVTIYMDTVLHIAVIKEKFDVFEFLMKRILRAKHKNSDFQEKQILTGKNREGNTLLHVAALKNSPKTVKALIKCGVDVNAKNSNGDTALKISESQDPLLNGNIQVRNILLKVTNASSISSSSASTLFLDDDEDLMLSPLERWKICINRYKANMSNDMKSVLFIVALIIIQLSLIIPLL